MEDKQFQNKNVSSKKRFIIIVEINHDLREMFNIVSRKEGLTQKELASKIFMEYAIKLVPKFQEIKNLFLGVEESTKLFKRELKFINSKKLTEEEKKKLKEQLITIYNELKDKDRQDVYDIISQFEIFTIKKRKSYGITEEMLDGL